MVVWTFLALPFFGIGMKTDLSSPVAIAEFSKFAGILRAALSQHHLLGFEIAELERSLVFPILLFSSISWHWSLRKAFLPLLAILWNSAFRWVYLSFSPLPLTSLLFSGICKTSSDNHFAFLHFFFLGMVLITASCTMSLTSVHSSSGTLSIRSNSLKLFLTSTV